MCSSKPTNPRYAVDFVKRFVLRNDASVSVTLRKKAQLPFVPGKAIGILDKGMKLFALKVDFDVSYQTFIFECFVSRAETEEQFYEWVQQFKAVGWKEDEKDED